MGEGGAEDYPVARCCCFNFLLLVTDNLKDNCVARVEINITKEKEFTL